MASAFSRNTALNDSVDVPTAAASRVLYTPAMPRMGPSTRVEKLHTRRNIRRGRTNCHQSNWRPLRYFDPMPMRVMAVQAAASDTATLETAPSLSESTPFSTAFSMLSIVAARGNMSE